MKTLKTRLIAAIGAATMILSVPMTSMASWEDPDVLDIDAAVANITNNCTKLLAKAFIKTEDIKIVNVEDVLSVSDLADLEDTLKKFTVQLELITLKNTLNHSNVLNGNDILTFADFLNQNDVDINDVISVSVFDDGRVLVWEK